MNVTEPPTVEELNPAAVARVRATVLRKVTTGHAATPLRRRTWRRPVAIAAVLTAAAGIAAVAVVSLTSSSSNAYAGWSPTPTPVPAAQSRRLETLCRSTDLGLGTGGQVVLAEQRNGSYFLAVASADQIGACTIQGLRSGPTPFTSAGTAPMLTVNAKAIGRPAGAGLTLLEGIGSDSDRAVFGRTGPQVRSVVIHLPDGHTATATVTPSGWWGAYYPVPAEPTSITVTDNQGNVRTQPATYTPLEGPTR